MADELGCFVPFVGGPDHAVLLLPVLEGLAGADETVVREAALESLGKVLGSLKDEQVVLHVMPIVRRLAGAEWFPRKSSAAHLIGLVAGRHTDNADNLDNERQAELRRLMTSLSHDDTTIVRKAVLNNLAKLIRGTRTETGLIDDIHPLLSRLGADPQDAVRLLAVGPLAAFGEMLGRLADGPEEAMAQHFHPLFHSLTADPSWRIRYMLAKHYSQLALVLSSSKDTKGNAPSPINAFCALLRDAEPEVRTAAAAELVHVAKVVAPEEARTYLIPCLPGLVTDASPHVKAALALSLNEISPIVGPNSTVEHILPMIIRLLSDENSEVRLNVVTNFERTVQVIGIDLLYDVLLPAIARLSIDAQWRVRETCITLIPALALLLGHQRYDEKLAEMGLVWLDDSVWTVRKCAARCHALLIGSFGTQWALDSGLIQRLLRLSTHHMYLRREVALQLVIEILKEVSVDYVTVGFLLPVLERLRSDPVPNVRISLARTIQAVTPVLLAERPDILRDTCLPILQQLSIDADRDVQFFAHQALNLIPAF